jgi:hypothetical protein
MGALARLAPALVLFGAVAAVAVSHPATVRAVPGTEVVVLFQVQDRNYDGTTDATVIPGHCLIVAASSLDPIDDANLGCDDSHATATFVSRNAGVHKATSSDIGLTGDDAVNYTITQTIADGLISPIPLDIHAATDHKTYDGGTTSTATPTHTPLAYGDSFTALTQAFDSKDVLGTNGSRLTVAFTLDDGNGGANYVITTHHAAGTITPASLTVTATYNNKAANGGTSAEAAPAVGPTFGTDVPHFTEAYTTATAGANKTLTPSGYVDDGNDGNDYSVHLVSISTGNIYPAPAASLTFSAGPIDTQVSTPIYSKCIPAGSGTNPCAATTANPGSLPVTVTARDAYNNLAGPGAPGDDGDLTHVAVISVDVHNLTGGALLATVSTAGGVASFDDPSHQLVIGSVGDTRLKAIATSGYAGGTAPNVTSDAFLVASQLKACQGTVCTNQTGNSTTKTYGQIVGQVNFYGQDTNVLFTTALTSAADTSSRCGSNSTIGSSVEQRVSGYGVQIPVPAETQVIVIPISTLQAAGIASRNAAAFSVCLGAVNLNSRFDESTPWKAQGPNGTLIDAVGRSDSPGTPGALFRYWGVPAACGTPGLSPTDPCIALKTKNANELKGVLGLSSVSSFFSNSDIAIVIREPFPWDGKGGVYS